MNSLSRRQFLQVTGAATATSIFAAHGSPFAQDTQRPNIIFIMTDDMGYGDTTAYWDQSKIPTPNMERLAAEGMRFTDAHTPSAVCTPTRYGLLTGRYCWRTWKKRGVFGGYNRPLINEGRLTLPSLLKRHGYGTACVGKWHLGMNWTTKDGEQPDVQGDYDHENIDYSGPVTGGPTAIGFDYFFGCSGCPTDDPPFCYIENEKVVAAPELTQYDGRRALASPGWDHEDVDVDFTNKAIAFIENHIESRPDDPFFVYLPLSVPHIPWIPPRFTQGESEAGKRGDQVVVADWCIGKIDRILKRHGLSENTLLIFTSDNGPREGVNGHLSSGPWRGQKGGIWEGGHRVPFIARWPEKIEPGTVCEDPICLTDMLATFAGIVGDGLTSNEGEDSFSILPTLLGESGKPARNSVIHHSGAGVFAIRRGNWKLIVGTRGHGYHEGPDPGTPGQLYDLDTDPTESNNLWDARPEIVRELATLLHRQKDQGHTRPM